MRKLKELSARGCVIFDFAFAVVQLEPAGASESLSPNKTREILLRRAESFLEFQDTTFGNALDTLGEITLKTTGGFP